MLILAGFILSCNKNDNPSIPNIIHPDELSYYYLGEEIPLTKVKDKFYMAFYSKNEQILRSELAKAGIDFPSVEEVKRYTDYSYDLIGSGSKIFKNYMCAVVENVDYEKVASELTANTIYWAPYYQTKDGYEVGLTEGLAVKLNPKTSIKQILTLLNKYSVEMMGADKYLPGWFMLVCTNRSKGNSLELANIFYRSGLFEETAPDFIVKLIY